MTKPPTVLVVDDDPAIRELMAFVLQDAGYEVRTASDGSAALRETTVSRIDLILLDMRMPGMDGWQFTRQYRRQGSKHAPIIAVTAAENAASRAAEIGAEGYLAKPFGLDELSLMVHRYLRRPDGQD